ncbi:uncharacterized protein EKO05_0003551 [Ascochyta rabiei]|uniref:uncharacterized protein n=1 Tax=Didymella rabiei TaxID=5454 RepID=UPI0022055FBF|nr:uncharacterized protein EKO05_0003551 [Ascochyta rabiei]UPX13022.1 hypothetical protein EKO05_0003551 [Ascochyta rabiei]
MVLIAEKMTLLEPSPMTSCLDACRVQPCGITRHCLHATRLPAHLSNLLRCTLTNPLRCGLNDSRIPEG